MIELAESSGAEGTNACQKNHVGKHSNEEAARGIPGSIYGNVYSSPEGEATNETSAEKLYRREESA